MHGIKARAPQSVQKGSRKAVWRLSILGQLGEKVNHNLGNNILDKIGYSA